MAIFRSAMRTPTRLTLTLAALAVPTFVACSPKPKQPEKPAEPPPARVEAPAPVPPPVAAASPCVGPFSVEGAPEALTIGTRTFERTGARLDEKTTDADARAVLGVIANVKNDEPDNLANVKSIVEFFKKEGVDAVVFAGDAGETQQQIQNALEPVAASGLPVFVVIGNRERRTDFDAALAELKKKYPGVVNLNQVRLAALDDVALVSLPGYHDKAYIHAEDGCHYLPADVEALKPVITAAGGKTVVMVSHGSPRQEGTEALDRTLEQANVGDPELARVLRETGVKFGVFANIQEAGGRATDLGGTRLVPANKPVSELFLNAGAADAVSWEMNDGTRSVGMAAVLTVDGRDASYKVFRIKPKGAVTQ